MSSKYRELDLLKEQEHTLLQLHMKFSDQMNRLKVEELALTNLLRLQKEREMQAQTGTSGQNAEIGRAEAAIEQETMQVLDLLVSKNPDSNKEEEEEDEEEEEEEEEENDVNAYNDQLTTFLEDLLHQQKEQQQQLHLNVGNRQDEDDDEDT